MVVIGLDILFMRPKIWLVLLYPAAFFLFQTQMKVNFHRNFIQIYPFLGLLFAAGCMLIVRLSERLSERLTKSTAGAYATAALIVGLLVSTAYGGWRESMSEHRHVDSRSSLIGLINGLPNTDLAILPTDLRIHEEDLRQLRRPYAVKPAQQLGACDASGQRSVLVVPAETISYNQTPENAALRERYRVLLSELGPNDILARIGDNPLGLDGPTNTPRMIVARRRACSQPTPGAAKTG